MIPKSQNIEFSIRLSTFLEGGNRVLRQLRGDSQNRWKALCKVGGSGAAGSQSDEGLKSSGIRNKNGGVADRSFVENFFQESRKRYESPVRMRLRNSTEFSETFKNNLKRNENGEVAKWNIPLSDRDLRIDRKRCATVGVTDFERFLKTVFENHETITNSLSDRVCELLQDFLKSIEFHVKSGG